MDFQKEDLRATDVSSPFQRTLAACVRVDELVDAGWQRGSSIGKRFELESPRGNSAPSPTSILNEYKTLSDIAEALRMDGQFGGFSVKLETVNGSLIVTETSGSPDDQFTGGTLEIAERASQHQDAEAALSLAGTWSGTITVNPTAILERAIPSNEWRVFRSLDEIEQQLSQNAWWSGTGLFHPTRPVAFALWSGEQIDVSTSAFVFFTLPNEPAMPSGENASKTVDGFRTGVASPQTFAPYRIGPGSASAKLALRLWRLAAAASWGVLASDISINDSSSLATLEFFGLRRTRHNLDAVGPQMDERECRDAYELSTWASLSDSPDRLLAVRQVVSLYHDDPPWEHARDIQDSAQPVFLALRSDAVAEALAQQRAARALAFDVARQSATAAAALARGAVERCLASLAAVGGVIVAKSTVGLSEPQAESLQLLVAVFLGILALWSILIEGPPVTAPTSKLQADLERVAPLLAKEDRMKINTLASVRLARRHANTARMVVPVAYATAAFAAWLIS